MFGATYFREISAEFPLRLTPGPFEVSPTVLEAASRAYCGHRSKYFRGIIGETREMLLAAYQLRTPSKFGALLLTGTGSAAMEMMICSTVVKTRPIVIVNGRFSRRLADMCLTYNRQTRVLDFGIGCTVDVDAVEDTVREGVTDHLLFCVQDTRDCILNPYDALVRVGKAHGHLVTIDAISAAVFEAIDFEGNDVDIFVDSSGKGIRSLPGVGIVVAKRSVFQRLRTMESASYYLDLVAEFDCQDQRSEPRFAPAVSLYVALHQALTELLAEGVETRRRTVKKRSEYVRSRFESTSGLRPLRPWSEMPSSVTSVCLVEKTSFGDFAAAVEKKGILLYPGSSIRDDCFQVGTGGYLTDALLTEALDIVIDAIQQTYEVAGAQ